MNDKPCINPAGSLIRSAYEELNHLRGLLMEADYRNAQALQKFYFLEEQLRSAQTRISKVEFALLTAINLYPDLDSLWPEDDSPKMFDISDNETDDLGG